MGGTIKATLLREDIERVLGEGFLPVVSSQRMPANAAALDCRTRLALCRRPRHYPPPGALSPAAGANPSMAPCAAASGLACPTHMLFNGGVLNADLVRERILATLDAWLTEEGFQPVSAAGRRGPHARGFARRGLLRAGAPGRGVRIRGGIPRTYYVGVESSLPSIPGLPAPSRP